MDIQEAINSLFSKIKSIDPCNARRILGYILLKCRSDQDLLDFAISPHSPLLDVISGAKFHLELSSNTLPAPISRPKNSLNSSPLAHFPTPTGPNSDSLSRFGDTSAGNTESRNNNGGFVDGDQLGAYFYFLDDCAQKNEEIWDFRENFAYRLLHRNRFSESDACFRAGDGKFRMGESSVALMGDEVEKFGQFQPERNDSLAMATEEKVTRASKFIYLTFRPNSSFKDSDVSDYFSTFGPVQEVKIPYRERREFGFVEFVHPETVKLVLSRPTTHYICSWPVLVKPYKEKGKVSDNSQRQQHLHQQLIDGGNYSPFSSPSGTEMLGQEPMVRKMLEQQAELQQAQWKRLLNLQIPNSRGDFAHSLSAGSPSFLPHYTPIVNQNQSTTSDFLNFEDNGDQSAAAIRSSGVFDVQNVQHETSSSETKAIDSHKGNHR